MLARPMLLVSVLLAGGCRTPADPDPLDSPVQIPAAERIEPVDPSEPARRSSAATKPGILLSTNEGSACERVCGSLAECLVAADDDVYSSTAASGLELECLELCVNAVESSEAKREFLDCERSTECGPLRACVEQRWSALASSQKQATTIVEAVPASDACVEACRWIYTCLGTNQAPADARLEPGYEEAIAICQAECPNISSEERDKFVTVNECLKDRCPDGHAADCWGLIF